ncbi:hypothetical protein PoB_001533900 [Plakobranchus ocellatus]|uniref:Uncharacterized protein n=1 Tax=Plakobranchus ocellatus TaxID=259542 RepID=A0AAV3Z363_9GAST|nr:hypothetical protein PoB_001533900 [Plakobranchus ocellatus]
MVAKQLATSASKPALLHLSIWRGIEPITSNRTGKPHSDASSLTPPHPSHLPLFRLQLRCSFRPSLRFPASVWRLICRRRDTVCLIPQCFAVHITSP